MATTTVYRDGKPYDTAARDVLVREARRAHRFRQPRGIARPDGPSGTVFVMRQFLERNLGPQYFADIAVKYPRIAHWNILGQHLYAINDADLIDKMHRECARDLHKGRALHEAKRLLGDGLLTSEDEHHLRQRRLAQPAFHRDRIAEYGERMVAAAVEHESDWREGDEVDMVVDMSALTLDIVGRTLFTTDLRADADGVGRSLTMLLEAFPRLMMPGGQLISKIPGTDLHGLDANLDDLDVLVGRMISDHRAGGDQGDLLSMLIAAQEDGHGMDDGQLRDEVMTLVLAGHETTAMNLSWTWYLLSQNPGVAAWLREEFDAVLGGRPAHMGDLANLPRTRAVIHESLRLYPPAWIIGRMTVADIEVDGWTLPKGSAILTSQYAMQRDPRYWASALSFRPERWLDADGAFSEKAPGQPRGAWFPFGYGKRQCIGDQFALTEAALVLATLAQTWAPRLVPGTPVEPFGAVTLRPADGLPMILERV